MNKPKRQPKNFFQQFVNEYILFRHDFHFVIDAELEIVIDCLRKIALEDNAKLVDEKPNRNIILNLAETPMGWSFEIISQQALSDGYEDSAKAAGIFYKEDGLTHLEGSVSVNGGQLWINALGLLLVEGFFVLLAVIFSFYLERVIFGTCLVYLVVMSVLWNQMHENSNYLYHLIQEAVKVSDKESIEHG